MASCLRPHRPTATGGDPTSVGTFSNRERCWRQLGHWTTAIYKPGSFIDLTLGLFYPLSDFRQESISELRSNLPVLPAANPRTGLSRIRQSSGRLNHLQRVSLPPKGKFWAPVLPPKPSRELYNIRWNDTKPLFFSFHLHKIGIITLTYSQRKL